MSGRSFWGWVKRGLLALVALFAIVVGVSVYLFGDVDSIEDIVTEVRSSTTAFGSGDSIKVTFYGVSTILIDDGETQVMIDGFFSRPPISPLLLNRKFSPNVERLKRVVDQEKLTRLAVVIPGHSHHDHAMDSAPLAELTGATVLGSDSTANIARGWGLPEAQIAVAEGDQAYGYGRFRIRLIESRHSILPSYIAGKVNLGKQISKPLRQPAKLTDYAEGKTYAIHVEHPEGRFLINSSPGFKPHVVDGLSADVVFLGVVGLSDKMDQYLESYLRHTVYAVSAKTIVPVHWDSFMKPASRSTLPKILDNIGVTMGRMEKKLKAKGVSVVGLLPKRID